MPSHNLDIDARDLSEAPRLAKDPQSKGTWIALISAVLLLLALLVYGSLPELSPEEIVAMDGYAGEQPTKHIFNIHSLEEKPKQETPKVEATVAQGAAPVNNVAAPEVKAQPMAAEVEQPTQAETAKVAPSESVAVVKATVAETAVETVAETPVAAVAPQQPAQETVADSVSAVEELPMAVVETIEESATPVVTTGINQDPTDTDFVNISEENKVVAAMATTPTISEAADTVVVSSVAALAPVPVPVSSATSSDDGSKGKLLPLRSVLEDFTELKASPSAQSKTLLSLGRGVIVTAFERHGKWIHIGTNDGSSITGFVLESSLGRVDTKNSG